MAPLEALNRDEAAPVDCTAEAEALVDDVPEEVEDVIVEEEVEEDEVVEEPVMKMVY
jgi:hypothetical protein